MLPQSITSSCEEFGLSNSNSSNFRHYFSDEVRTNINVPYVVVEALVASAAVLGNAMVIFVFCCERKLRRKTNYYIISLAFADLLMGLFGIPFAILVSEKKLNLNSNDASTYVV